jgi:mono/diheme cytochrome c family protein
MVLRIDRCIVWAVVICLPGFLLGPGALAQEKATEGAVLYAKLCASCHGKTGDGRGRASRYLFPKARDLRHDQFRLVSTLSGNPSLGDIYRVLEEGIPGSSMQSWKSLGDEKLGLLVERVMQLRTEGAIERIVEEVQEGGDVSKEEADRLIDEYVKRVTRAGEPWEGVGSVTLSNELVARGGQIYIRQQCGSCHGRNGRGSPGMDLVDLRGDATWATDLARGRLHGGSEANDIARRIFLGMPGSGMPSSGTLGREELASLVAYCLSLSAEPKDELTNHQRRERAIGRIPGQKDRKSP